MAAWTPHVIVIGSGLAGLSCAHRLALGGSRVTVLSPGEAGSDGATHRVHALAPWILLTAPWLPDDSPELFYQHLEKRSGGLTRNDLLRVFTEQALPAARELVEMLGLQPLDGSPTQLPDCAAHRAMRYRPRNRKRPILTPLLAACNEQGVELRSHHLAVGLLLDEGRAAGAIAYETKSHERVQIEADAVVLATGGMGAVFPICTEPRWCRGSALSLAGNLGAELFHPHLSQSLPVRSLNHFFPSSRAVLEGSIEIDGRKMPPIASLEDVTKRIAEACRTGHRVVLHPSFREDPNLQSTLGVHEDGMEIQIALHQGLGGVAADSHGRTSCPALYVCGEAAGGVQGRTRAMGTGLLEARIFGIRAAQGVLQDLLELGNARRTAEPILASVPDAPREFELKLDTWLGPLTCIRPREEVQTVLDEIENWPLIDATGNGCNTKECIGWFAALRRQAALEILSAELAS